MKKIKDIFKRTGAAALAATMLITMMPVTVFADELIESDTALVLDELPVDDGFFPEQEITEEISEETTDAEDADVADLAENAYDRGSDDKRYPYFEDTGSIDDVRITATADEGVFPEGAVLYADKAAAGQEQQAEEAVKDKRGDEQNVAASYTYDIKVLDKDGNVLQPAGGQKVKISFELPLAADKNLKAAVYHVTETGVNDTDEETDEAISETETDTLEADASDDLDTETADNDNGSQVEYTAEKLEADMDRSKETITVETEGFSLYIVEFTYGDLQYVLEGGGTVRLADIVSSLGLEGDAAVLSVSNDELFSASDESGEWMIASHKAFSSEEWMKISINGVEYLVTVTDDSDDVPITSWSQMRDAVKKSGNNNKTLRLDADISANGQDRILIEDKTLTIDLNGYTMNRGRTSNDTDGHVIEIQEGAYVTIKDSSASGSDPGTGVITGGWAKRGGGIHVGEGTTCIIEGGHIRNNKADIDGGGIYVRGTLKMTGGFVTDNYAKDTAGGIYCVKTGTFEIENVTIANNTAKNDGGAMVVHLKKDASIKNSNITGNKTEKDDGGAIRMDGDGKTLNIVNTDIVSNVAHDKGGGIIVENGTVKMNGGSVKNNTAIDGGGVYNEETIRFENVEISGNVSTDEGGAGVNNKDDAVLKNCTIKNNTGHDRGGGIYAGDDITLEGCTIEGNKSTNNGGGVCFNDVNADVRNCTFIGNHTDASGGGIYIKDGRVNIIDTTVTEGNSANKYGGGICIDDDADVYFSGTNTITNNRCGDGGGGLLVGYDTDIAGIKDTLVVKDNICPNGGNDLYLRYIDETKLFSDWKIYSRKMEQAELTLTGKLSLDSYIGVSTEETFTYISSDITVDYSKYHDKEDPARYFVADAGYNVVSSTLGEAFISTSNWSSIQRQIDDAAESGGTVTIVQNWKALPDDKSLRIPEGTTITVDLNGYTIDRNRLSRDAKDTGEVFTVYGALIIKDSSGGKGKISGGHGTHGGGVYVHKNGSFTLEEGNIEGNKAVSGGGIYNYLGNVSIKGGTISGNSAVSNGGGVYNATPEGDDAGVDLKSVLDLSGGKITNNDAGNQAGGVYLADQSELKVKEKAYVNDNGAATGKNILLFDDSTIDATGALDADARLDFSVKLAHEYSYYETDKRITKNFAQYSGTQALTYNGTAYDYTDEDSPVYKQNEDLYLRIYSPAVGAEGISNWKDLYNKVGNTNNNGKKYYLANDLKADNSDHQEFEVKTDVEIDLCGHFINRNSYKGSVFRVKSGKTLTIKDTVGTGTICGGIGDDDGGGVYVENDAILVMRGGTIANNKADETGGGIYCSDRGTLDLDGVTITHNSAKDKGGGLRIHLKDSNSWIRRCTISNNTAEDDDTNDGGGGISISANGNKLTITDSVISDNTAKNGGGIFAYDGTNLVLDNVTISGNCATKYGGAGINNTQSDFTLTGCTIANNTSEATGAGIWTSTGSNTTITGCTFTANHAKTSGGGIHAEGSVIIGDDTTVSGNIADLSADGVLAETDLHIKGKVVIFDNVNGQNVFLKSGKKLILDGSLTGESKISVSVPETVSKENGRVFTTGFGEKHPGIDPAEFFYSDDGYSVLKTSENEAEIRLDLGDGTDFIDWTEQITDTSRLTAKNWMSGISGDRYLNEINLPCTHDSSMNSVTASRTSSIGALMGYSKNAKTQIRYINEQMNEGVRRFDIRLTYYDSRGQFDSPNLYNNHGKDKTGGTFWALDPDGNAQTLEKVLGWVKGFLKEHPTEVIILDLQPEPPGIYIDKEDVADAEDYTYHLAQEIIRNNINGETNPSTGKPYVYWRNGEWKTFKSFPQLKECRGQVIFKCDKNQYIGGINDTTISPVTKSYGPNGGATGCSAAEKIQVVRNFLQSGFAPAENIIQIPKDVTTHLDRFYSASVLAAPVGVMGIPSCTPLEASEKIHNALFYNEGLFDQKGQYVGWIRQDGVDAQLNKYIWASNFPDDQYGLNYVTVTVKSDINGVPDQTYRLLKGTKFKIPDNIYGNGQRLYYWNATVPSGSEETRASKCYPNTTYTVMNNVTFTADWDGETNIPSQTPISAVWSDDNYIGRPDNLTVTYVPENGGADASITISKDDVWEKSVTDSVSQIKSVTCNDGGEDKTIPRRVDGQTVPGEYCYEAEKNDSGSWIITLYRTEELQGNPTYLYGTIVWDDYDNADGKRPSGVKLNLLNGSDIKASQTLKPDEDNWSWYFNLGTEPSGNYSVQQANLQGEDLQAGTGLEYYETDVENKDDNRWVIVNHLTSHTHNLTHVAQVDATCTKDGNIEYWYCDVCGGYFSDGSGSTEITDAENEIIIPATGHNLTRQAAKNATCTENGHIEYWHCDRCEEYFSDENGEHKVNPDKIQSKGGIIINATKHSWRTPAYTWAKDNSTVTAKRVCNNDASHYEEGTATATSKVTREPVCDKGGETVYTAIFKEDAFDDQQKTEVTPALGHSFGEWIEIDSPGTLKQRTCTRCGKVETIPVGQYAVEVFTDGHGTASASPEAAEAKKTIKLTAVADKGYRFKEWTSPDGVKFADTKSAVTTFVMPAKDVTVMANFEAEPVKTYTVKVKTEGKGSATAKPKNAEAGRKITIKATPDTGNKFVKWKATKGVKIKDATKASTTFFMPNKNVTVTAVFEKIYVAPQPDIEPVDDDKIVIEWWKVKEAKGYDIFMSRCNHGGKKITPKKVKTIKGNKTFRWIATGLEPNKSYKAYIRAYTTDKNGKKKYISKSPLMHVYTAGGTNTYTNAKSVKINTSDGKIKKGKLTLKVKGTYKIKASVKKTDKDRKLMPDSHVKKLRYRSSDPGIATVSSSGKITAKKKGKCEIYVYAHNGVNKTIKVTVK